MVDCLGDLGADDPLLPVRQQRAIAGTCGQHRRGQCLRGGGWRSHIHPNQGQERLAATCVDQDGYERCECRRCHLAVRCRSSGLSDAQGERRWHRYSCSRPFLVRHAGVRLATSQALFKSVTAAVWDCIAVRTVRGHCRDGRFRSVTRLANQKSKTAALGRPFSLRLPTALAAAGRWKASFASSRTPYERVLKRVS